MTELTKLKVSLTKHGAHKVLRLIENYPPDQVLENTWGKFEDIKIDRAQTRRNLSAFSDGNLPGFWQSAKDQGDDTLRQLVFLAILFSHYELIEAFQNGAQGGGKGKIVKDQLDAVKAFTNLKNDIEELGFAVSANAQEVAYDLSEILENEELGELAAQMFTLKLMEANWARNTPLVDECINLGFHQALSCSEDVFHAWLLDATAWIREDDELPDTTDADKETTAPFLFRPGHTPRKEGKAKRKNAVQKITARLLHNAMQNALYKSLAATNGEDNVGTELPTGSAGTSIDLAVKNDGEYVIYEIKTSPSVKKCIRQALPQLLEYAYWPNEERAKELVVVSPNPATEDTKAYMNVLRERFNIPIYHRSFDLEKEQLSEPV